MYLSPEKHILSHTLMQVAIIRLLGAILGGLIRFLLRNTNRFPDMSNKTITTIQIFLSALILIVSLALMLRAMKLVSRQLNLVPESECREIALLQEDFLGDRNAALSAEVTLKLLQIWSVILIGVQVIYDISTLIYRKFATYLARLLVETETSAENTYVYLYNLTHGFKYQGMFLALLLGAMVTGIFLNDRLMKTSIIIVCILYLLSMAGLEMSSFSFMGQNIGIVWSSVIFHTIETLGLVGMALHLRIHYHGV